MSLEGRLRELALPEVLQLLGITRKTGRLQLRAQVQGRAAYVALVNGAVTDAAQWRLSDAVDTDRPVEAAGALAVVRAVEACVLDLLTWRDGDFRFLPAEPPRIPSPVRLSVDALLVQSAQRSEGWLRIEDRVPHAEVVPTFVDVEPQQLPLLRLESQEWEILTRVDGLRDLKELADVLGREVLDVAEIVHRLIGAGLLTLREVERAPRRNETPPIGSSAQARPLGASADLWIPRGEEVLGVDGESVPDEDSLFDPVAGGVQTAEGFPRRRTTPHGSAVIRLSGSFPLVPAVAPTGAETSVEREDAPWPVPGMESQTLCAHGDDAARRGDLAAALTFWSAALRSEPSFADADRIREAIALASRLHALLHSAGRRD